MLLCVMLQDALSEESNIYLPLKLRVFVEDITAPLIGKNKEVAEMAKKAMKSVKRSGEKRASNCQSLRMERKERVR